MKKFLTLIITCFLSLSLAGCSNSKNNDDILTFFDALGNTLNLKSVQINGTLDMKDSKMNIDAQILQKEDLQVATSIGLVAGDHPIIVLCGRPYHLDPLINHQMNQLLTQLGFVVVSEESVPRQKNHKVNVLNQWTYHARLYQAAHYVVENKDMNLIQLVSFGCGIDAITSDEVRDILKDGNKFYTQIKIDEIDNLGAAKIRLRSLKEAIGQQKGA